MQTPTTGVLPEYFPVVTLELNRTLYTLGKLRTTVGSSDDADIKLNDQYIRSIQFEISLTQTGNTVQAILTVNNNRAGGALPCENTRPTYVNGRPVTYRQKLVNGDEIRFGYVKTYIIKFSIDRKPIRSISAKKVLSTHPTLSRLCSSARLPSPMSRTINNNNNNKSKTRVNTPLPSKATPIIDRSNIPKNVELKSSPTVNRFFRSLSAQNMSLLQKMESMFVANEHNPTRFGPIGEENDEQDHGPQQPQIEEENDEQDHGQQPQIEEKNDEQDHGQRPQIEEENDEQDHGQRPQIEEENDEQDHGPQQPQIEEENDEQDRGPQQPQIEEENDEQDHGPQQPQQVEENSVELDKIGEVDDNLSKLASWDANIKTSIEHNSFEGVVDEAEEADDHHNLSKLTLSLADLSLKTASVSISLTETSIIDEQQQQQQTASSDYEGGQHEMDDNTFMIDEINADDIAAAALTLYSPNKSGRTLKVSEVSSFELVSLANFDETVASSLGEHANPAAAAADLEELSKKEEEEKLVVDETSPASFEHVDADCQEDESSVDLLSSPSSWASSSSNNTSTESNTSEVVAQVLEMLTEETQYHLETMVMDDPKDLSIQSLGEPMELPSFIGGFKPEEHFFDELSGWQTPLGKDHKSSASVVDTTPLGQLNQTSTQFSTFQATSTSSASNAFETAFDDSSSDIITQQTLDTAQVTSSILSGFIADHSSISSPTTISASLSKLSLHSPEKYEEEASTLNFVDCDHSSGPSPSTWDVAGVLNGTDPMSTSAADAGEEELSSITATDAPKTCPSPACDYANAKGLECVRELFRRRASTSSQHVGYSPSKVAAIRQLFRAHHHHSNALDETTCLEQLFSSLEVVEDDEKEAVPSPDKSSAAGDETFGDSTRMLETNLDKPDHHHQQQQQQQPQQQSSFIAKGKAKRNKNKRNKQNNAAKTTEVVVATAGVMMPSSPDKAMPPGVIARKKIIPQPVRSHYNLRHKPAEPNEEERQAALSEDSFGKQQQQQQQPEVVFTSDDNVSNTSGATKMKAKKATMAKKKNKKALQESMVKIINDTFDGSDDENQQPPQPSPPRGRTLRNQKKILTSNNKQFDQPDEPLTEPTKVLKQGKDKFRMDVREMMAVKIVEDTEDNQPVRRSDRLMARRKVGGGAVAVAADTKAAVTIERPFKLDGYATPVNLGKRRGGGAAGGRIKFSSHIAMGARERRNIRNELLRTPCTRDQVEDLEQ